MSLDTLPAPKDHAHQDSETIADLGPLRVAAIFWEKYRLVPKVVGGVSQTEQQKLNEAAKLTARELNVSELTTGIVETAQKHRRMIKGAEIHARSISPGAKAEEEE
jgi:hypothetical protein